MTSAMRPCMSLTHVYLYPQAIDFRKSFRGISAIVECELGHNPFSGHLYVFTSTPGFLALAGSLNRNTSLFVMLDAMTGVISI